MALVWTIWMSVIIESLIMKFLLFLSCLILSCLILLYVLFFWVDNLVRNLNWKVDVSILTYARKSMCFPSADEGGSIVGAGNLLLGVGYQMVVLPLMLEVIMLALVISCLAMGDQLLLLMLILLQIVLLKKAWRALWIMH